MLKSVIIKMEELACKFKINFEKCTLKFVIYAWPQIKQRTSTCNSANKYKTWETDQSFCKRNAAFSYTLYIPWKYPQSHNI